MNHRRIAAPLALALGLSACGTGQTTATETADSASAAIPTSSVVDSGASTGGVDSETSRDTGTPDQGDSEIGRVEQNTGTRLKSSVLGAAVEQVAQTSARFEASIEIVSVDPEMPGTLSMSFSGGYDIPNQSTTIEMDLSGFAEAMAAQASAADDIDEEGQLAFDAFFAEPMRVITIGDESWVQGGFFSIFGVEPGMWLAMESDDSEDALEDLASMGAPFDPTEFLAELEDANVTISELGTETVRGAETTHYLAEIDLAGLAELSAELSPQEQAELDETLSELGDLDTLALEFWIGTDDLLRRMQFSIDTSELPDNDGITSMTMTFELFDYGADLGITAPDPSLVVEEGAWD